MNSTQTLTFVATTSAGQARASSASPAPPSVAETLQSRFALRVASRLTEGCEALSPDISERLRFAREQALLRARTAPTRPVAHSRGGWATGWRLKFVGVIPMLALVGGLVMIQQWQDSTQISVAADIDAALLSDDLPPTAYSDAGFVEYLKTPSE